MAELSEALKEAYASAPSDVVILHTLEFRNAGFVDEFDELTAIRVVLDNKDLYATLEATAPLNSSDEVRFVAMQFGLALPGQNDRNSVPEIIISLDNVSRLMMEHLRNAQTAGGKTEVTYRAYLSSDLTGPQNDPPLTLDIIRIEVTQSKVTARATYGNFANRRFPNAEYDATTFPTLAL
jgi:hypothetical protein